MSQKTKSVEEESVSEELKGEEVMNRVRSLVGSLLEAGASAPDITFALTYIATELGLVISEDPLRVFPVVLGAISRASADRKNRIESAVTDTTQEERPEGATVH